MSEAITNLFPLWAILFSVLAYFYPEQLASMKSLIVPLLSVIMFSMGLTLTPADFKRAFEKPLVITLGVLIQYLIMPLAAFLISKTFGLSAALTVGMVLVGSVSGGTASNVICYLAKGDVALSITMTVTSTILAVIATPFFTWAYVSQTVPVPLLNMLISILRIVLIPVALGVAFNKLLAQSISQVKPILPLISMLAIVAIIAIVVALNQDRIASVGVFAVLAVILHNLTGLIAGYWVPKLLGYNTKICRTVAIEVGMQNSGLGVALAIKYFSPLAALPGALFSVRHNISGSLLASYWSTRIAIPRNSSQVKSEK